jgi:hypothetical protein
MRHDVQKEKLIVFIKIINKSNGKKRLALGRGEGRNPSDTLVPLYTYSLSW